MRTTLLAGIAATVFAGAAQADEAFDAALDYVDVNDDGVVEFEEFASQMGALFDLLDTSGDAAINRSEASVTMSRELFDGADTDGSGWISRAEFDAQVARDFDRADIDKDGDLD